MPSPIAHIAAGYAVYRLYKDKLPGGAALSPGIRSPLLLIAGLSLLPDLDVLFALIFGDMERYHNNFSHSLFFGLAVALICASLIFWKYRSHFWLWFVVSLISYDLHVVMDYFTGERGVMLLWPLIEARFSSPIKLFIGVQWGQGFFTIWHLWTILTETLFFITVYLLLRIFDNRKTLTKKVLAE
jgi:membrane-bound metal-dependent hydrolase YbcI (DUF457 family)